MAEFAAIARPYAKALFGVAQEQTKLSLGWADWETTGNGSAATQSGCAD